MTQYPADKPASRIAKPDRPESKRYWDDTGQLAEEVPRSVVEAVRVAIDRPPKPDVQKARRLATLLRRAREG